MVSIHVLLNPRSLKILFDNQTEETTQTTTKDVFVSLRFGFVAHVFQPFWDDHFRLLLLHVRLQQLPTTKKQKISPDSGKKEQWIVGSCAVTITKDMPQVNPSKQMSPSHQQGWPALCSTADSWFDQRYQTAFPPLISSETTKLHNTRILLSFATPERLGKVVICKDCETSYGSTNPIRLDQRREY